MIPLSMLAVVIPNQHSPQIGAVLTALHQQTAAHQIDAIIVVGQDHTGQVAQWSGVDYIALPRPTPPALSRDIGAYLATSEYILFLDADCIARPDLIERLLACHAAGQSVVSGSIWLAVEAGIQGYWTACDNTLVFAPWLHHAVAGAQPYLPSCCLSVRRAAFLAAGGFGPHHGVGGEDIDLSLRLRNQGHLLWFEPRAVVEHRHIRTSAVAVWQHLRGYGRKHPRYWQAYPMLMPTSHRIETLRPLAALLVGWSLPLALRDVVRLYRKTPVLRRYWHLLPGLVFGKSGWYWGVAETLYSEA
ncbi:MAG: glycosyltransferase [Chloroflexaceae bacterium]|nr:glycosyltransferase [Chloroflexaceae bacterium]NJL33416.1 glycosyltransferase [Chloroflexaceae bacterium]NJO06332.1 glycosyltransferase [Chloroflexaceae bacterium]NJO84137.1 glycosyltransferase [Blastochloris sp.]